MNPPFFSARAFEGPFLQKRGRFCKKRALEAASAAPSAEAARHRVCWFQRRTFGCRALSYHRVRDALEPAPGGAQVDHLPTKTCVYPACTCCIYHVASCRRVCNFVSGPMLFGCAAADVLVSLCGAFELCDHQHLTISVYRDAASSEISLFSSDYRRKRVCTAQPCCCMTNRLRCALLLCHTTHMAHPSDTAMHARRLRVDSESSCSTSCGSTDSIKSHRHSISLKRDRPVLLALCALALDSHRMGVYCTDTRPCKTSDDCVQGAAARHP